MVDEMIEQAGQRAIMAVVQGAGRIAIKLVGNGTSKLAHALTETGKWPVRKTRDTIRASINSGRMSEKRLQNLSGGDLHQIRIDDESIREVTRSLKQAGVNYSIEQCPDGTWLHFAGRDNDHIMHAVQRAFNKLGIDFNPEEDLEKTTPLDRPDRAKEIPESTRSDADPDRRATKHVPRKKATLKEQFRTQVRQRTKQKLAAQGKPKMPIHKPTHTR